VLSHRNLLAGVLSVIRAWGWTANDRLLLALPLFHLHGLGVGLNGTFTIGSTAHVHSAFEAERAFEDIEAERPTMIFGVPAMYHRLVDHESGADLSSLRLAVSGSAPLPEAMFLRISERLGVEPLERYGMTETLMNISNPLREERRPGTVGLPLPGVEVRLVVDGEDVSPGGEGEIWLRGPNVFSGYRNDPAATEASFTDGWFMSGDLARADGDGYIRITGRAKDLIITGGYNVHPREVEDVLADHPGIREAAVVGTPSDEWGEQVTAFVVPTSDALDVEELVEWCDQRLARYKIPKEFHLVDELPRNALGKLQRHLLRPP
jgi:malonyl-CoA/methylmalonyl-CoA synthetase